MKIFFDSEFTGLHKNTTLISIGLISEDGKTFYGELRDYDKSQVNEWILTNVINHTSYLKDSGNMEIASKSYDCVYRPYNNKIYLMEDLKEWLWQFRDIEMISDCLAYDWILFCDLFGNALNLPRNISYIPTDICTIFRLKGIDPDISREEFIDYPIEGTKHTALYDAKVIKACYEKLTGYYS
jgi:hypothetical protein